MERGRVTCEMLLVVTHPSALPSVHETASSHHAESDVGLCMVPCTGCALAQSAGDGVWIFDSVRSHVKPGQLTIEGPGDGYQWGGVSGYHAGCRGLPGAGPDGFTIQCGKTAQEVRTTLLEHRRPFSTIVYKLSAAGKALQVSTKYMHGRRLHSVQINSYVRNEHDAAKRVASSLHALRSSSGTSASVSPETKSEQHSLPKSACSFVGHGEAFPAISSLDVQSA